MGQNQSGLQYLPEFVRKWYWWRTSWGMDHVLIVAMAAFAVIGVIGLSRTSNEVWLGVSASVALMVGSLIIIHFQFCQRRRDAAVAWVDRRMAEYGLRLAEPSAERMDQVLAAFAHLLHDSPDTDTARARKMEFRQARGLMELLYGAEVLDPVSTLRERFPLRTLKHPSSLISVTLRDRIASIRDVVA